MIQLREGHFCPYADENEVFLTPAPSLYVCEECERSCEQLSEAEYDEHREGHMLRSHVKNEYSEYPDMKHHWDIESAISGGVQVFRLQSEPKPPRKADWRDIFFPNERRKRENPKLRFEHH
jgi:hypothetical protein